MQQKVLDVSGAAMGSFDEAVQADTTAALQTRSLQCPCNDLSSEALLVDMLPRGADSIVEAGTCRGSRAPAESGITRPALPFLPQIFRAVLCENDMAKLQEKDFPGTGGLLASAVQLALLQAKAVKSSIWQWPVAVAGASSIVMPRSWNAYLRKVQVSRLCLQDNARYCILRLARKYMQLVVAHSCVDASHSAVRKASSVQSLDAVRHLQKSMAVPAPQASRAPEIQRPKESRRGSGDGLRGPKGKGV